MANQEVTEHDHAILNKILNPNLPFNDCLSEAKNEGQVEEEEGDPEDAKRLDAEGVKYAEEGDLEKALETFNKVIEKYPKRASGYNNRAQAFRLKGDVNAASEDLDRAIELSDGKGKAASQAYTQRAMIKRLQGKDEEAMNDFQRAANLGNKFAKQQAIALNPYAALCNQMLGEVFTKMKEGKPIE